MTIAYLRFGCSTHNQGAVAQMTLRDSTWLLTSTRPTAASADGPARRALEGAFGIAPEYAGCGSCGASSYVKCGACGQLNCWNGSATTYRCFHCGASGPVSGSIDSLSAID